MKPNPIVEAYKLAITGCQTVKECLQLDMEILNLAEELVNIVQNESHNRFKELVKART